MFDFSKTQESSRSYIGTGVHEVIISDIKKETNDNGNTFMEIEFSKEEGGNKMTNNIRLYMTEKAMPSTQQKLLNIGNNVSSDFTSLTSFEEVAAELIGKPIRIRFNGEEYLKQDGTVGIRPSLPLSDFAEAIIEGALHDAVPAAESQLTFDKDKHIRRIDTDSAPTATLQENSSSPYGNL